MKAENFFSEEENRRIESAIADAEKKTSGEIVAMVVDRSGDYRDVVMIMSLIAASLASVYPSELVYAASTHIIPRILPAFKWFSAIPDGMRYMTGLVSFIAMIVILFFPFRFLLMRFPSVTRLFINDRRRESETRERAISAFHEKGLSNTKDATGVLFLISLFERKVYVLADHGIYEKISQHQLDGYVSSIAHGISKKNACEALVDAIREAGTELARHFPVKPDDINELSDKVLSEK